MVRLDELSLEDKKILKEEVNNEKKQDDRFKDETAPKERPIRQVFIPLGQDYNSKFTLWKNSLQIVKSHKENNVWSDTQNINLSKRLLIELMSRIPSFVAEMEAREE